MYIVANIRLNKTINISNVASMLFFIPNCIGVYIIFEIRFIKNKNAILPESSFLKYIIKTFQKEIIISIYKKVHTGQNTSAGGAKSGFINSW